MDSLPTARSLVSALGAPPADPHDRDCLADTDPRSDDEDPAHIVLEPFASSVAGHSDASRADLELESARGARSPAGPRFSASYPRASAYLTAPATRGPQHNPPGARGIFADQMIEQLTGAGAARPGVSSSTSSGGETSPRPLVVSSQSTAHEASSTPENPALRFIMDMRELTKFIAKRPIQLESMQEFIMQMRKGDYLWSVVLGHAHFHVPVHRRSTDLSTAGRDFVFLRRPFGLASGPSSRSAAPRRARCGSGTS